MKCSEKNCKEKAVGWFRTKAYCSTHFKSIHNPPEKRIKSPTKKPEPYSKPRDTILLKIGKVVSLKDILKGGLNN